MQSKKEEGEGFLGFFSVLVKKRKKVRVVSFRRNPRSPRVKTGACIFENFNLNSGISDKMIWI